MRRILRTAVILVVVLYTVASIATASTLATATATSTTAHRLGTLRCGVSVCDLYLSRGTVRALTVASNLSPAFRVACVSSTHPLARVGCHVLVSAIALARQQLTLVADRNQCLRIRFVRSFDLVIGLSSDGSSWCRD